MKGKIKKLSSDPRELSLLEKRGTCIFIQIFFVVADFVNDLFDLFERGKDTWYPAEYEKKKLSNEEKDKTIKEVASYFCFETLKQIWEFKEGDLSENDARKVSDVILSNFYYGYGIHHLNEKIKEYKNAENPSELVSRNILKIVRKNKVDTRELTQLVVTVSAQIIYFFVEGVRRMFELSEEEMIEMIGDFSVKYYPPFIKTK